ncbi:hypothetical protein RRG08_015719 [Elysia crispata]|uniref:Uncharacterized protein n=1 Tax=Elysia crispata TaxID=231223 RepID=A0AAE0Z562_9GAST|nr:hypothetical protein RRG08_015719 [Elysia crispata]
MRGELTTVHHINTTQCRTFRRKIFSHPPQTWTSRRTSPSVYRCLECRGPWVIWFTLAALLLIGLLISAL